VRVTGLSFLRKPAFAHALMALALIGLGLRMAAPTGFMLAPVAGQLTVVLCTGHGPQTAVLDLGPAKPDQHAPKGDGKTDAPCVFAVAAHAASPAQAPIAAPAALACVRAPSRIVQVQPGCGLAAPPPWATGPPAFA
jgi:hypothetical protein